jgi:hypothetical protein
VLKWLSNMGQLSVKKKELELRSDFVILVLSTEIPLEVFKYIIFDPPARSIGQFLQEQSSMAWYPEYSIGP